MQAEASGNLNLDTSNAARLGLGHHSPTMLKLISAATNSRHVHACEAACTLLDIPPVTASRAVKYVRSHPPRKATNTFSQGRLYLTPVQLYKQRHSSLNALTFTQYHEQGYVLVPRASKKRPCTSA